MYGLNKIFFRKFKKCLILIKMLWDILRYNVFLKIFKRIKYFRVLLGFECMNCSLEVCVLMFFFVVIY